MMRSVKRYTFSNIQDCKRSLLTWAKQFEEVVWLDSNSYEGQTYPEFEGLLAVEAFTSIQTDSEGGFDRLEEYQQSTQDWIFGYLGYDLKNDTEKLSSNNEDHLGFSDLCFFQPKKLFLLYHDRIELHYLRMVDDEMDQDWKHISKIKSNNTDVTASTSQLAISLRIHKEAYKNKVRTLLDHIARGDIYEANLCQEFYAQGSIDPWATYTQLNAISRPPFATFLRLDQQYLLSASPERYIKKIGAKIVSQPIKGTAARGSDVLSDHAFAKAFNGLQTAIKNGWIAAGHDVASGGLVTTLLELCFADNDLGAALELSEIGESDLIKLLFSENVGVVFQATDQQAATYLQNEGIKVIRIGSVVSEATLTIKNHGIELGLNIASLRDTWFKTSYLLDDKQTANELAKARYENYKQQPLHYQFPENFTGTLLNVDPDAPRPKAAILREKGSNSEREMANAMYLAGFDVKDVHMTDLISGRETLEDIQFLGAVGGFSNSDVLGSAKGWAGAIKYNEKANKAIKDFFAREDTLSIGICNGCQLFLELDLINPDHEKLSKMHHNDSQKHESGFTSVKIQENNSVMLSSLAGTTLGVWISHGEGKFHLPMTKDSYDIVGTYGYEGYPANPNGSDYNTAMICDSTGRHLATMPHIERSTFPWNWAHYPNDRSDTVSPWLAAFVNAKNWLTKGH